MNKTHTIMNKNVLYWIIALLVVLNTFTMFMLWQDHWNRKADMHNRKPGMFRQTNENKPEFIQRELNLSDEQAAKFRDNKKKHIKNINQITERIHKNKKLLLDNAFSNNPDSLIIDSLINDIGNLQKKLEETNITHINNLKRICKPKQFEKLKNIFNELMLKTEPPARKRPGKLKSGKRRTKVKNIK